MSHFQHSESWGNAIGRQSGASLWLRSNSNGWCSWARATPTGALFRPAAGEVCEFPKELYHHKRRIGIIQQVSSDSAWTQWSILLLFDPILWTHLPAAECCNVVSWHWMMIGCPYSGIRSPWERLEPSHGLSTFSVTTTSVHHVVNLSNILVFYYNDAYYCFTRALFRGTTRSEREFRACWPLFLGVSWILGVLILVPGRYLKRFVPGFSFLASRSWCSGPGRC